MLNPINASLITSLHKERILHWKAKGIMHEHTDFMKLVEENHAFNYQLWHAEDRARREDMGFEYVYEAKREIDFCNQQRNNRMEAMDEWLFLQLKPEQNSHCPVHSESPGMMIDRLSILSLKAYHMALQTVREEADATHKQNCAAKLEVIQQQWDQLGKCLDQLLEEVLLKTRTFRVYHQHKMYNDPKLNPHLYS